MRDYDVTSAGISAEQDRHHRMKVYFIMMAIRMACVASLIWVRGWWILLAALGGVFLPYLAVLIANQPKFTAPRSPDQPEPLQLTGVVPSTDEAEVDQIIVIDEPADRRAAGSAAEPSPEVPTVEAEPVSRTDETPAENHPAHELPKREERDESAP